MKANISKGNKNKRWPCSPVRFFNKIGDVYVKIMSKWANQFESTGANLTTLPKSFSVNSSRGGSGDEDLKELLRIASRRGLANGVESEFLKRQGSAQDSTRMNKGLHSRSMCMGKIGEDEACDFDGGDGFRSNHVNFVRSRSHVIRTRNSGMF